MYGPVDADAEDRQASDETPSIYRRLHSVASTLGPVLGMTAAFGITIPFVALQLQGTQFRSDTQIAVVAQGGDRIHSAIQELGTKAALDNVIRTLNLASGEENRPNILRVVSEVLSGDVTTVSQTEEAARQRLRDAISIRYDTAGSRVLLAAKADDPQTAAAIANQLGGEFRRALVSNIGETPSPQVEAMRKAAGRAEAALAGFVGRLDGDAREKLQSLHDERRDLETDIAAAEQRLAELRDKQQMASAMKLADVLARPLPDSLEFTGLEYERQRYVQAELSAQQLAVNLGPLHPRLVAAKGALDGARRDIGSALRQLVASLDNDVAATAKSLSDLKDRKTALDADRPLTETATQLASLQAAAEEARHNLEKLEASSHDAARPVSASMPPVLVPASSATAERLGPDVLKLAGAGALAGLFAGIALAAMRYRRQSKLAEEFDDMPVDLDLSEDDLPVERHAVRSRNEPVADELIVDNIAPAHDDDGRYHDHEPVEERFAANDTAFGDRMRALLIENRLPAKDTALPQHVGALVDQSLNRRGEENWQLWADAAEAAADYDEDELLQLQRELAELRELVAEQTARRFKATG